MRASGLFEGWFLGGFECSTHVRPDGKRLDLVAATRHDVLAEEDYRQLADLGVTAARDGLRWHLVESADGRFDWSTFRRMLRAASRAGIEVVWDLCHYGLPDHLDLWAPELPDRFARFAAAAARVLREETDARPFFCPVNEISFWAWAAGDMGRFHPVGHGEGAALKRRLVRMSIVAMEAIRAEDPRARFVHADPAIHVVPGRAEDAAEAEQKRLGMYEAWDMIAGRVAPELGGRPALLDVVGVNYYWNNQWVLGGETLGMGHPAYKPLHVLLREIGDRYGRPILLTETGAEAPNGPGWLGYVTGEVLAALDERVPIGGICLYPVLDYPGWDDDRHCPVGLLRCVRERDWSARRIDRPMARALAREQARLVGEPRPIPAHG